MLDKKHLKACLVVKGYSQVLGIDFYETFSLVIKPTTIRVILTIALAHAWEIHQLDVKNAFLHGELTESVFMEQLSGFKDSSQSYYVCSLKRALYGLR